MSVDEDADTGATFGSKLTWLFTNVPKPGGGGQRFTQQEVAETIGVTRQHISDLMRDRAQPRWPLVQHLAKVFGVKVVFFDDGEDGRDYTEELQALKAFADADVKAIALRTGELTSEHRGFLLDMVKRLQSIERGGDESSPN